MNEDIKEWASSVSQVGRITLKQLFLHYTKWSCVNGKSIAVDSTNGFSQILSDMGFKKHRDGRGILFTIKEA